MGHQQRATIAALAIAFVFQLAGFARADVYFVDVMGTVSGQDGAGVFGPRYADLTGQTFALRYTIDTSKGFIEKYQQPGTYVQAIDGGPVRGTSTAVTATMTIDGASFISTLIDESAFYFQTFDPASDGRYGAMGAVVQYFDYNHTAPNEGVGIRFELRAIGQPPSRFPVNLFDDFAITTGSHYVSYGADEFYIQHDTLGPTQLSLSVSCIRGTLYGHEAMACPTSGGVPEPATWLFAVSGFMIAGAALRQGRAANRAILR